MTLASKSLATIPWSSPLVLRYDPTAGVACHWSLCDFQLAHLAEGLPAELVSLGSVVLEQAVLMLLGIIQSYQLFGLVNVSSRENGRVDLVISGVHSRDEPLGHVLMQIHCNNAFPGTIVVEDPREATAFRFVPVPIIQVNDTATPRVKAAFKRRTMCNAK